LGGRARPRRMKPADREVAAPAVTLAETDTLTWHRALRIHVSDMSTGRTLNDQYPCSRATLIPSYTRNAVERESLIRRGNAIALPSPSDLSKFLTYGAVGLGLALALLAAALLATEQRRTNQPRVKMLRALHIFMAFAFAMSLLGYAGDYLKYNTTELRRKFEETSSELDRVKRNNQILKTRLSNAKTVFTALTRLKGQELGRLEDIRDHPNDCVSRVRSAVSSLDDIGTLFRGVYHVSRLQ
jgi:hypothetical protein